MEDVSNMTTAKSSSFWKRLGSALGIRRRRQGEMRDLPEVGDDGLLAEPAELPPEADAESAADRPARPLTRWAKRDLTLAKLQEGYEQVTRVVEQIGKHLVTQDERSERICTSLEQLARSMSDVPNISREQARTLDAIAGQLESTNARTRQLADGISEIPKIARTQAETLAGINRQLEMAGEQNVVASQTMEKLGTAIHMLGESNQSQAEVLKQMDTKAAEQNHLLTQLIARQSRRFTMLFFLTIVLAAAAIALGILGLTRPGG